MSRYDGSIWNDTRLARTCPCAMGLGERRADSISCCKPQYQTQTVSDIKLPPHKRYLFLTPTPASSRPVLLAPPALPFSFTPEIVSPSLFPLLAHFPFRPAT